MKADNKYLILSIGMAVIAAILTTETVLLYRLGGIVVLFLGFTLGAPVLIPYIALLVIFVKSLGKKDQFHKNPRYKLRGIYEGEVGEYWYNAENPISVWHRGWSYRSHDYREMRQTYDRHLTRQEQARKDSTRLEQYLRYNYIQKSVASIRIDYSDSVQYRQRTPVRARYE